MATSTVRNALGTMKLSRSPSSNRSGEFPRLDSVVQSHIESALRRSAGRIEGTGGAAALLGINPHTLRARMRKLGIKWGTFRN